MGPSLNMNQTTSQLRTDREDQQVANALKAAKDKLAQVRERLHEPLAIVGVGCRFPDATGPEGFWDLLQQGSCPIRMTPNDRWSDSFRANRDKEPGHITANQGAFLDEIDLWDAAFFGVSPREAASLDPQQRLLLTTTWEALEHAGISADRLRGSRTGVFIGICGSDYLYRLTTRDLIQIDAYLGTGNAHGTAAGRLSYFFNWHGPSMAIDTACSSSLVAVHMAARSLRAGDCDLAVVGGVNLMLTPELSITLSQSGMLSPTGRCHAFAAEADGFVRGEGCGVVLLKRLSQARADGDSIYAVLRGSAVNQDGRSNGLTAPNALAQQAVLRLALADAQLAPADLDYVEAHGTGTALGDPIEMSRLGRRLRARATGPATAACRLGEDESRTPRRGRRHRRTDQSHLGPRPPAVAGPPALPATESAHRLVAACGSRAASPPLDRRAPARASSRCQFLWIRRHQRPCGAGRSAAQLAPTAPSAAAPAQVLLVLSAKTASALAAQAAQWSRVLVPESPAGRHRLHGRRGPRRAGPSPGAGR